MNTLSGIVKNTTGSHSTAPQPVVASRNAGILFTTPGKIIADCAAAFGVPQSAIVGVQRGAATAALARHAAMAIIQAKCRLPEDETAAIFGRDRSTVNFAKHKVAACCETDLPFRNTFQALLAGIIIPYRSEQSRPEQSRARKQTGWPRCNRFRPKPGVDLGLEILACRLSRGASFPGRRSGGSRLGAAVPLEIIAAFTGLSSERIRQIENEALQKLRIRCRHLNVAADISAL